MLIIEINRLVKRAFDVAGRVCRIVETAEETRTYFKDAHRVRESMGENVVLQNALNIFLITVIIEAGGGEKENTWPQRVYQGV